jgi:hypothetical protein
LEEQLEPQLIALRRGEPAIHQVIEPEDKSTGVRAERGSHDGPRYTSDNGPEQKWPHRRTLRHGRFRQLWATEVGWILDLSRHPFVLPEGLHKLFSRH